MYDLAVEHPFAGVGDVKFCLGAGDPDVAEPTLLLDRLRVCAQRVFVGK